MKKMKGRYGLIDKGLCAIPVDLRPMPTEMKTAC